MLSVNNLRWNWFPQHQSVWQVMSSFGTTGLPAALLHNDLVTGPANRTFKTRITHFYCDNLWEAHKLFYRMTDDTLMPTVHGFSRGSQKSHVTQHNMITSRDWMLKQLIGLTVAWSLRGSGREQMYTRCNTAINVLEAWNMPHYLVHKSLPLIPVLSQMNEVYTHWSLS
jgi:hypothetical protein